MKTDSFLTQRLACRAHNPKVGGSNPPSPILVPRVGMKRAKIQFFNSLYKIKDQGIKFKLVVLGENFHEHPKIFDEAKNKLKNEILHIGYSKSYDEYIS